MIKTNERMNEKEDKRKNDRAITDATSWDRIREELFPSTMFRKLPKKELDSCELLVDTIANSSKCYSDEGDVVARYDEVFELVFKIQPTLLRRYEWHNGQLILRRSRFRRLTIMRPILMEMRPSHKSLYHLGSQIACVWGKGGNSDDPVMNDCAGFVLWADSGFPGFAGNLSTSLIEYRMRTYFGDIVDRERVRTFSLDWEDVFEAYETAEHHSHEDDESDFERIARRTILGWMLFPDSKPFTEPVEEMDSYEVARKIFEEFDEDRRYQ